MMYHVPEGGLSKTQTSSSRLGLMPKQSATHDYVGVLATVGADPRRANKSAVFLYAFVDSVGHISIFFTLAGRLRLADLFIASVTSYQLVDSQFDSGANATRTAGFKQLVLVSGAGAHGNYTAGGANVASPKGGTLSPLIRTKPLQLLSLTRYMS